MHHFSHRATKAHATAAGFTLMELLTVIAIIGVLASVVLASTTNARNRGRNASAQASLQAAQLEAERFFDQNQRKYFVSAASNVCTATAALRTKACTEVGCGANSWCQSKATPNSYAISVALRGGGYYCVDGKRFAGVRTTAGVTGGSGATPYTCPAS